MAGRPKKSYAAIYRPLSFKIDDEHDFPLYDMPIICPICKSFIVGPYGIQSTKNGSIEKFQCKNPCCSHLETHKTPKQFNLYTSGYFKEAIHQQLPRILPSLLNGKTSHSSLGKFFHRSPSLITYLRHKVEKMLENHSYIENLVLNKTNDYAVAGDETFLNIAGKSYYLIILTGYQSRKVLGLAVSQTRDVSTLMQVFKEAEQNSGSMITILSVDGWGAYQTLARELNRPFTLVIHKHKKPYDKAVVWKIEYGDDNREIIIIGTKVNFFKKRAKREYFYEVQTEKLINQPKGNVGRPKGVKNGQGKKKKKNSPSKKRGRRGLHGVFKNGKKGYAKVDPYRKTVKISKEGSYAVGAALNDVIKLYAQMTIQNNLAENKNSVVEHYVWFSGRKTPETIETRVRTFFFFQNNPTMIDKITIDHTFRSDIFYKQLKSSVFGDLISLSSLNFMKNKKGGCSELIITN